MNKLFFTMIFLLSFAFAISAQDIITQKNGQDLKVKVEEIGTDYVKFKYFEEPEGPSVILKKSEIFRIQYQSGRVELFKENVNPLYDNGRKPLDNITPGLKYKQLKKMYNHKEYVSFLGDNSPGWCGVASFFIPGLGQGINNEWGRAAGQFFGSAGLMIAGSLINVAAIGLDEYGSYSYGTGLGVMALACFIGALGIDIWSIVDAVKITKVKNMYKQDLRKLYALDMKIYPSMQYSYSANGAHPTVGLTLAMNF